LFRDLGLGATLVVRTDLGTRAIGTLFTLTVAISAVVATAIAATAPLASRFFTEPRLSSVLAVLAASVVINSVGGFYDSLLQRELQFRIRFYAQIVPVFAYAVTATVLAALGVGVWSLVVGQVVQAVIYTSMLLVMSPVRVRPTFDRRLAGDVLASSRGFLLQGAVTFVHLNSGTFAVGRMLDPSAVGHYSMGYRMAELPTVAVAEPVSTVTFPGFARMRHRGEDVGPVFLTVLGLVALGTAPLGVMLSAAADPFTRVVLGQQWVPAIPLLTLLGLWAVVRPLQSVVGWFLNSVGFSGLLGRVSLCIVVPLVPALLVGAAVGSLIGVATVMLVEVVTTQIVFALVVARRCDIALRTQWRAVRTVLLAAALCWSATRLTASLLDGAVAAPIALTGSVVAGLAVYGTAVALVDPALFRLARAQLSRVLRGGVSLDVGGDSADSPQ
jgi:O-antigen/teichoic acid export membrane protein